MMARILLLLVLLFIPMSAFADSVVFDGPGFKMEKSDGWFGRHSTVYQDALGNTVERRQGFFGRKSANTRIFGTESTVNGSNVSVQDANGNPLITTKRTLFHGKQTHVNGNGIMDSIQNVLH